MSEDDRVDLVSFTGSTPVKSQSTFYLKFFNMSMLHWGLCNRQLVGLNLTQMKILSDSHHQRYHQMNMN